jgi:hypothetical protein
MNNQKLADAIYEAVEAAQISDNLLFLADEAQNKHRESLKTVADTFVAAWEAWKASYPVECAEPQQCWNDFFEVMKEKGWIGIRRYPDPDSLSE